MVLTVTFRLGCGFDGVRQSGGDVPREELLDAVDGMIGDASHHLAEICFRVETVEFRRGDQTVDNSSPISARIGTCEEIVLPSQGDGPRGTFGSVYVAALQGKAASLGRILNTLRRGFDIRAQFHPSGGSAARRADSFSLWK